MPVRALQNLNDAPRGYEAEVRAAAARALRAGARPPLTFVGMGMTGVVFEDARGRGFKVGRRLSPENRKALSDEADWLRVASTVPEIRGRVARFGRYHRALNVIEREHVKSGVRPTWSPKRAGRQDRWELHETIGRAMRRHGWSAPEFKEDSYVFAPGRGWVLVDASLAHRVGSRLAARAGEVLRGVRFSGDSPSDLAWEIRMESGKTIPPHIAERLSDRLLALPNAETRTANGEARDRRRPRARRSPRPRPRRSSSRVAELLAQLSEPTRKNLERGETGLYAREDLVILEELERLGVVQSRAVQRPTRYTGPMTVLVWVPVKTVKR